MILFAIGTVLGLYVVPIIFAALVFFSTFLSAAAIISMLHLIPYEEGNVNYHLDWSFLPYGVFQTIFQSRCCGL